MGRSWRSYQGKVRGYGWKGQGPLREGKFQITGTNFSGMVNVFLFFFEEMNSYKKKLKGGDADGDDDDDDDDDDE